MSTKTPYWQLLQHPEWQKKRLEIFQRDEFKCQHCGEKEKPLHVHHWYYLSFGADRKPWEYPNIALITLCVDCHKAEDNRGAELNQFESAVEWVFRNLGGMDRACDMAELVSIFISGKQEAADEIWFIEQLKRRMRE